MRADNIHHLTEAARRRAQATRRRAVAALRRMATSGLPVTIDALAREAGVSRSWIYSQPDLRAEAERLRDRPRHATGSAAVPDRQRSSDASLLRRVEVATQRIRELENGLGGAVEKTVVAHSSCWRADPCRPTRPIDERTRARHTAVHELLDQGVGLLECSRRLGWSLNTVKRYARAATAEHLQRPPRYGRTLERVL